MKNNLIVLLIILFLYNFAFSQDENSWKSIDKEKYIIEFPSDWELNTSGQMNTEFILFSKITESDLFRVNVNLMVQDLTNLNLNLESYTELSEKQIKYVNNYKIIESKQLENTNRKYHQIIWSGFVSGNDLKFKQFYYIENDKAYLLTLTCHQKEYENYEAIGTKILNSFRLK